MKSSRRVRLLWACLLGTLMPATTFAQQPPTLVWENFARDPQWEGFRNRLLPPQGRPVRQDFGYRQTNFAGGERAGEIGGIVQRSPTTAVYAMPIELRSLNDRLTASGKLAVRRAEGASGVMIGWFRDTPLGWRTPSSLAFRIDGNGDKYWLFYEYGTHNWRTGGGGAFEGEQYQRTPTPPFKSGDAVHAWSLEYDPQALDGRGLITFRIDERRYELPLGEGDRQTDTTFNRFGIWNVQTPGAEAEIYLDDLVVNGQQFSFDADPGWIKVGNPAAFQERIIRPFHDYGYSTTRHAGGQPGEIGGILFRDEQPAYYAGDCGSLSLEDELVASGKLALHKAASDSACYLGWLNGQSKRTKDTPEYTSRQQNYLALLIEGPSRVGHYVRPSYGTRDGSGLTAEYTSADGKPWPILFPDASLHTWSLHYRPEGADGRGEIELRLDEQTQTMALGPDDRRRGATFDRFGVFNLQAGGHHVELYLDDLRYSRRSAGNK